MKYIVSVNFKTQNDFTENEVAKLFMEQWEQTAAFGEGDELEICLVTKIPDGKEIGDPV